MAVRDSLLAALTVGPAYGFQLHGELAARTGGRRTVNVGQSYATLERLGKQGLIESAGSTDDGLPLYRLTAAGRRATAAWLAGADATGGDAWDETVDRVLIALSLADVDAAAVIGAERERWQNRLSTAGGDGAGVAALAADADAARARAALSWLSRAAEAAATSRASYLVERIAERPRRGRRPAA